MGTKQLQAGFSLAECMIAGLVLALVASVAAPLFRDLYRTHQVRAAMFDLAAHVAVARSTSITRGTIIGMCPSASSSACAAGHHWTSGWLVYADHDGNRRPDDQGDIIASGSGRSNTHLRISTTTGRTQLRFGPLGTTLGTNMTFNICQDDRLEAQLIVSVAGRPRAVRPPSPQACPH